jgi:hypothetical protein
VFLPSCNQVTFMVSLPIEFHVTYALRWSNMSSLKGENVARYYTRFYSYQSTFGIHYPGVRWESNHCKMVPPVPSPLPCVLRLSKRLW